MKTGREFREDSRPVSLDFPVPSAGSAGGDRRRAGGVGEANYEIVAGGDGVNELIHEIRELIQSARRSAAHSVDLIQVLTNFEIGRRIVEHEQGGEERAEYGKALLKELSGALTAEFGRGFSERNLRSMRKFNQICRDRYSRIRQMPSAELPRHEKSPTPSGKLAHPAQTPQIWQTESAKFNSPFHLSWSQYVFLISIDNPEERSFCEKISPAKERRAALITAAGTGQIPVEEMSA